MFNGTVDIANDLKVTSGMINGHNITFLVEDTVMVDSLEPIITANKMFRDVQVPRRIKYRFQQGDAYNSVSGLAGIH